MNRTPIEWTDYSANPVKYRDATGKVVWACVHASPGCVNCYAEAIALRFRRGGPFNVPTTNDVEAFLDEATLDAMLARKEATTGKRCFVGDMTDIFGEWVPDRILDRLFSHVLEQRRDVVWQLLTKRAERMRDYLTERWKDRLVPKHIWLGVSVENQEWADKRIPLLLETPAAVRFISAEPLLSAIDLSKWLSETTRTGVSSSSRSGLVLGRRAGPNLATREDGRWEPPRDTRPGQESAEANARGEEQLRQEGLSEGHVHGCRPEDGGLRPSHRMDGHEQGPDTNWHGGQPQGREQETTTPDESRVVDARGEHTSQLRRAGAEVEGPTGDEKHVSEARRADGVGDTNALQDAFDAPEANRGAIRSQPTDRLRDSSTEDVATRGGISWLIIGGESGPGARPFELTWARSIVQQCKAAGVSVFYKQGGTSNRCPHDSKGGCLECIPEDLRAREFPVVTR